MSRVVKQLVLSVGIAAVFGGGVVALLKMRRPADRKTAEATSPPVLVVSPKTQTREAMVVAQGVVIPALEVVISPEVSGKLIFRSPELIPGGRFSKGQVLARIDPRDYELGIRQEESRVRRAELDLKLEGGRQRIAQREWALLGRGEATAKDASLALRKPHLAAAQVGLEAAMGGLERAKLNLGRTYIRAPFNAIVATERAEVGQVVAPGTQLASLIGTDEVWVRISVPVEQLTLLEIPGSAAVVTQRLPRGRTIQRAGRVLRLQGQLDSKTRTAQVLVTVEKPFDDPEGGTPLLPGAYVSVEITGKKIDDVTAIPRVAVYEGQTIYTATAKSQIARITVEILWGTEEFVFVAVQLSDGDRIITSPLANPIEGMQVRAQEKSP